MTDGKRLAAEVIGTFWLVFGGCGAAVYAAGVPGVGIGYLGVAFAFGLTVLTMAYAVGHVSGGHFNPAVTVGLWLGKRFDAKDVLPYIVAQVVGAIIAAAAVYAIAKGNPAFKTDGNFLAANGMGSKGSPQGFSIAAGIVAEVVLTFVFLMVILGVTDTRAPKGLAPLAIGLCLTLIHLISIPITNTSVNPARSTGPALFVGSTWLAQLPLFWVAPLVGGAIAGLVYHYLLGEGPPVELPETMEG